MTEGMVKVDAREAKEKLDGRILVLGGGGLVGSRFLELYGGDFVVPSKTELDITDPEEVRRFIEEQKPDFIINFAAYTNVSGSERPEEKGKKDGQCWRINVEGVRNILDALDPKNTHFIQISTDMVFSGKVDDPGPYSEDHPPEKDETKLTWYGFTKAEAERLVLNKLGDDATILRINYPVRAKYNRKLDYLQAPLAKYREGNLWPLFTDQQISITFIDEACEALARVVKGKYRGIFHAASSDITTPYEIIPYFIREVEGTEVKVQSRPLGDFEGRYAKYAGLRVEETQRRLGIRFSTWKEIADELAKQSRT
ncbi:hypothetical protein A2V56_01600 [Candidatus Woesebacteria bacterium RBG_19FT_COMBO_42_9]|uniref:dTDP-4-dehydrorhamnose reductase n=1 Tax=Candidatus Woesebacteria bacterium RBG_16_42_24 TaxID=1802485 RepID=A0A1F7XKC7_9BACT|nr:MAG: hypothetical protein A2V97_02365 [Candidatus Woesebacteria bacterium RBG_16_42_24]OGM16287.1 MAG: hypothetical protein A2V56_01600 [Candidatus Woesebacteria bacterium RBG_19FT_COMBO_42_9]OGM68612.1 MAG: hypothetical protein A2985_01155 [Candidatus Woesebacteria bacterium RIFCSPLOWO2_01_FULL_43_11]